MKEHCTPTATGTTLDVLAPYLPYGIEVEWTGHQGDLFRGTMCGLNQDHLKIEGERFSLSLSYCRPVLRPFSALCDPLPDGTVPAKEVLMLIDKPRWAGLFVSYVKRLFVEENRLMMEVDGSAFEIPTYSKLACLTSRIWGEDVRATVVDYLRSQHFAVGLKPHQYLTK